jgi:hypothetical protein
MMKVVGVEWEKVKRRRRRGMMMRRRRRRRMGRRTRWGSGRELALTVFNFLTFCVPRPSDPNPRPDSSPHVKKENTHNTTMMMI